MAAHIFALNRATPHNQSTQSRLARATRKSLAKPVTWAGVTQGLHSSSKVCSEFSPMLRDMERSTKRLVRRATRLDKTRKTLGTLRATGNTQDRGNRLRASSVTAPACTRVPQRSVSALPVTRPANYMCSSPTPTIVYLATTFPSRAARHTGSRSMTAGAAMVTIRPAIHCFQGANSTAHVV